MIFSALPAICNSLPPITYLLLGGFGRPSFFAFAGSFLSEMLFFYPLFWRLLGNLPSFFSTQFY
jgi:hypothetical protein